MVNRRKGHFRISLNNAICKCSLSAVKLTIEVDHTRRATTFAVGTLVAPVIMAIAWSPKVVAVKTQTLVQAEGLPVVTKEI